MQITIPSPLQIVIDDVGWWSGMNDSARKGPYRTGLGRMHCRQDYEALIRLARGLETNVYAAFVACEWDRSGLLRNIATATWMGERWANPYVCDYSFDEVRDLWNANRDCVQLALHGVGHEYWLPDRGSRSEFHDRHGQMRDRAILKKHFDAFFAILQQNGIDLVPELFVPPALKHNLLPEFAELLVEYNIRYVVTDFRKIFGGAPSDASFLHIDNGVMTFDRGRSPVSWDKVAASPSVNFAQPILPLHWANILHAESDRNWEVVDRWINYIRTGITSHKGVLTRDIRSCIAQYVFFRTADLKIHEKGLLVIDLQRFRQVFKGAKPGELMLLAERAISFVGSEGVVRFTIIPYDEKLNMISFVPERNSRYCIFDCSENS